MFILDTNVLSELMKAEGGSSVVDWADAIPKSELFTTVLNYAEIWYGIAIMDDGRKKRELIRSAELMFNEEFFDRILPFDERAALHFADITARRKRVGRRVGILDSQIAAIARANEMTIATRNVSHFRDCDVPLVDPWAT
jgi:predicted nucleic acid-binding protein